MKYQMRILQGLKLAAVLAVALSMGACANKNLGADAMANAATPGSQQDFVVNVGDRVFFDSDQTDLSPQAIATLEKQAQWLQTYNRYAFTIEGHADERGTREYNIALGARRAQSVRTFLASRGIRSVADADDLLRQGTPGRGLQRHLLLVAESSRGHGPQRQLLGPDSFSQACHRRLWAPVLFWRPCSNRTFVSVTFLAYSNSQGVPLLMSCRFRRQARMSSRFHRAARAAAIAATLTLTPASWALAQSDVDPKCASSNLRISCGSSPARTRNCSTATGSSRIA